MLFWVVGILKVERDFVIKASKGDKEAFSKIYYSCYNDFYNFAFYVLGNSEDLEDVLSDTFIEIWKGIGKLRNPESFEAWAFKILSVRCKKEISNIIKRRKEIDFDALSEVPEYGSENFESDIAENVSLADAFYKLESEEKILIVLSVIHGYTHREIGEMIGKPRGTVSSKLHRIYAKLRKQITEK